MNLLPTPRLIQRLSFGRVGEKQHLLEGIECFLQQFIGAVEAQFGFARFGLSNGVQPPAQHFLDDHNRHDLFVDGNLGGTPRQLGIARLNITQHVGVKGDHSGSSESRSR